MLHLIDVLQKRLEELNKLDVGDVETYGEGGHKPKDIYWAGERDGAIYGKIAMLEEVIKLIQKEYNNG